MSVSVVLPCIFRSLSLTILRGCSCCNAILHLVVFVRTLSGHVAVLSIYVVVVFTSLLPVLWSSSQIYLGMLAVLSICVVVVFTSRLHVWLCTFS